MEISVSLQPSTLAFDERQVQEANQNSRLYSERILNSSVESRTVINSSAEMIQIIGRVTVSF